MNRKEWLLFVKFITEVDDGIIYIHNEKLEEVYKINKINMS